MTKKRSEFIQRSIPNGGVGPVADMDTHLQSALHWMKIQIHQDKDVRQVEMIMPTEMESAIITVRMTEVIKRAEKTPNKG